ncbi:MAG: DNA pilot protein [Microviridae sp.]|nr:MAG: DNA pilot protein [Microviridae sp.]
MPFGPLVTAGIELGSSLLGAGINKIFGNAQHAQAIDDWNMQNAYNSPKAQMARLKDAGLNPNLVYGQLQNGNAPQVPQQQPSRVSLEGIYSQAVTLSNQNKQIEQTLENLKTNQALMQQNIELSKANVALKDAQTSNTQSQQGQRDLLTPYSMDYVKANTQKTLAQSSFIGTQQGYLLDENERRDIQTATNRELATQQILNRRAELEFTLQRTLGQISQNSLLRKQVANYDEQFRTAISQSLARTANIKQGTLTSMSSEQLNEAVRHLRELEQYNKDRQFDQNYFNKLFDLLKLFK